MNKFTYSMPVKVYFGQNCVNESLELELQKVGKNILVVYGGGSIKANGVYDTVMNVLKKCDKQVFEVSGIAGIPSYSKVLEAIDVYKKESIDFILAVGAGSVIDSVKAICAGAKVDEDIWDLQHNQHIIPTDMADFGVILTLSGAGSEMDCLGAVCHEELQKKLTFVGPYAKFAFMDPDYVMSAPLSLFMPGVFDSLTHCMETYFGKGYNVSDEMNLALMRNIIRNMKLLMNGNDCLEVRSDLMWDSSLVQTFLFNVGKPGDFQGHQIENCLGAFTHLMHGKQLAIILPPYYLGQYEYDIEKYARFAREVMEVKEENDLKAARMGIEAFQQLIVDAKLPTHFSEMHYELSEEIIRKVSETCGIVGNNARNLNREEVYQLLMKVR